MFFQFPGALAGWQRPDIGASTRVGTVSFRVLFFGLGPDSRIRNCIFLHLAQLDWKQ